MENFMLTDPAVFAVERNYQIMVPVSQDGIMWVRVAGENYYDDSNGILRSSTRMHRVTVPMEQLDGAGKYTVVYQKVVDRKPYFPELNEPVEKEYFFCPVKFYPEKDRDNAASGENDTCIHAYHIADVHNFPEPAIAAGSYWGDRLDFLILNGDIPNHSGEIENFLDIYKIASRITHGEKPVVFSRGNHDMRGFYAENFAEYTPTRAGLSFYTFRLGPIWGLVLDCGEDKDDTHPEYGGTVACTAFRKKQTAYLKELILHAKAEYEAPDVRHRIIVCHVPFTFTPEEPFDTDIAIYKEWARLLRENVHPEVMLCGHEHFCRVDLPGSSRDHKGQPCPVIVGAEPTANSDLTRGFIGTALTFSEKEITVRFTDQDRNVLKEEILKIDGGRSENG